jgi:hypothetical protein
MVKPARTTVPAPRLDRSPANPPAADEADLLAVSIARIEHRLRLLDERVEMAMKPAALVAVQPVQPKAAPLHEPKL